MANENMQQYQLSEEQKQLIEKNISHVRASLRNRLKKSQIYYTDINEVLSYIVEASYDFKKGNFVRYATEVCLNQFIQHLRHKNKYVMSNKKIKLVNKITQELHNENKEITKEAIEAKFKEKNVKQPFATSRILNDRQIFKVCSLDHKINTTTQANKAIYYDHSSLEWEDAKAVILKKTEEVFKDYFTDGIEVNAKNNFIYRTLIREYLIPMASGEPYPSIEDLAKSLNRESYFLYSILSSKRMKAFITKYIPIKS